MTNNPTIDGVSRELIESAAQALKFSGTYGDLSVSLFKLLDAPAAEPTNDLREHCKQCAEVVKTWPEWKQNCLGGAPAVERQADPDCEWCGGCGHDPYGDPCTGCAQSEVAAPQFTIVQLEDKLNKAIDLDFQRREKIASLEARIAELESGRGEPVAWLDLEKVSHGMAYATNAKINDRQTALYTAPPAPVAVVLPERADAYTGSHDAQRGWDSYGEKLIELNPFLGDTAVLNGVRK